MRIRKKFISTQKVREIIRKAVSILTYKLFFDTNALINLGESAFKESFVIAQKTLEEIDSEMNSIQDAITVHMKEYLDSYERIKQLLGDQTEGLKNTMSPEEFDKKIQELIQWEKQ